MAPYALTLFPAPLGGGVAGVEDERAVSHDPRVIVVAVVRGDAEGVLLGRGVVGQVQAFPSGCRLCTLLATLRMAS